MALKNYADGNFLPDSEAVARIAEHESHRKVELSGSAYGAATSRPHVIPAIESLLRSMLKLLAPFQ